MTQKNAVVKFIYRTLLHSVTSGIQQHTSMHWIEHCSPWKLTRHEVLKVQPQTPAVAFTTQAVHAAQYAKTEARLEKINVQWATAHTSRRWSCSSRHSTVPSSDAVSLSIAAGVYLQKTQGTHSDADKGTNTRLCTLQWILREQEQALEVNMAEIRWADSIITATDCAASNTQVAWPSRPLTLKPG